MSTSNEIAVREDYVITPADRAAAAADAGLDSWLIVMKDVILLAEHICNTSFVPKAYRGNAPATAAAILTGRELQIPPMTALRHVQVVEGVPSLDAEYKRARVLAAGHELDIIEWDNDKCVMSGRRRGSTKPPLIVSYTMKDARIAGLVREGGNYIKRPRVMTLARATTLITNAIFADVTNGLATTELLESGDADVIADYAGTGPDIPGLRPERPRVTAADARARRPQTVPSTAETVETVEGTPDAASGDTTPATPAPEAAQTPADDPGPAPGDPEYESAMYGAKAQFKRITGDDEELRLAYAARILRIAAVATLNDLTLPELREIVDTLAKCRDRDALEVRLTTGEVPSE